MARTKGMLNLSGNLEVNAGAPLDARSVVPTVADLTVAANFQYKYVGMTVVVQATGDMYILTANDVTVAANWKQVGSGGGGSSYTAGDGIDITNDEISVKAGSNLSFDSSGNLNATDTTYTAGDSIAITDNVISVNEMASADMSEIVTPLPSVGARLPRYSTEEQIVAYWIDGKPVYQCVAVATNFTPTTSWQTIATLPANIEQIIKYDFILCNPASSLALGENADGEKWECYIQFDYSSNILQISVDSSYSHPHNFIVIYQYTKTTD